MGTRRRVSVAYPGGSYDVVVGVGALVQAAAELDGWCAGRRVFVVSSPRVRELHGARLAGRFADAEERIDLDVPEGEAAKSLEVVGQLWEAMLTAGGKRDSRLVALGGGTVGDAGGFVAACFLRGIEFVGIPTTLLAQVDASVGGKTAIDLPAGKNTVGSFHQPALVIADVGILETLPDAELRAGLVEVVKMASTLDLAAFEALEESFDRVLARDEEALARIIADAVELKRRVVEQDPREGDRRRLLNFGHTLGHALEAVIGYGRIRHGEAVAHGMRYALGLASARALSKQDAGRVFMLLQRLELPELPRLEVGDVIAAMRRDKKARESGMSWVLPTSLGDSAVFDDVGWDVVEATLRDFLSPRSASPPA
ncbi:MAG: 3-dehydroquinate synthase [Acidobacteriota bacterium]|nr:3-dehydroquinate synthase [Acidobacteriota bacterium]